MHTLIDALLVVDDAQVMESFLQDLLTPAEYDELGHRWEIAQRLAAGASYQSIESSLGVSSTTIARVAQCVHRAGSGYVAVLSELAG